MTAFCKGVEDGLVVVSVGWSNVSGFDAEDLREGVVGSVNVMKTMS